MKKQAILFLVLSPLLSLAMIFVLVLYLLNWHYPGKDLEFVVKSGESFPSINYRLKKEGVIRSARVFHYYVRFLGNLNSFKEGIFLIKSGSTTSQVLDQLINGRSLTLKITIPEGKNLFEIARIFEDAQICSKDEFIKYATDPGFMLELSIPAERAEGYLFPETYQFPKNTPAKNVIKKMVQIFQEKTASMDLGSHPLSKHELITLASIVEKETGAKSERAMIAGVFHNRIKKRMRLESDPTTIYGIWERFDGNLRKSDLIEVTPYNTYKIAGLPYGPIANPGPDAIQATLTPAQHDYLFFVSKDDGTHIFSETYNEHEKAVSFFQKNRANREGKSWRDLKQ